MRAKSWENGVTAGFSLFVTTLIVYHTIYIEENNLTKHARPLYSVPMSDTQTAISRAIAVLLVRSGKTQAWLAKQAGLQPATLSNRMVGRTVWDVDDITRIAAAFDLDEFEFLRLAEAEQRIAA